PTVRKLPAPPAAAPFAPAERPSEPVSTALESDAPPLVLSSPPFHRPVIQATAPERYRIQFTMDQETHDTLRRLQTLLRPEIPSGDPAAIVGRALRLLREKVEKARFAATSRPRPPRVIRPETDTDLGIRTPPRHP